MPIHDWTRAGAGGFHNFHQDWTIEIYRALNRGILPAGYAAYTDMRVEGYEPDVVGLRDRRPSAPGGPAVVSAPPRTRQAARVESDSAAYARKGNRIAIKHDDFGTVVAVIEVVSPGNKNSRHAVRDFRAKALDFILRGVNFLLIDVFPPTPRDPAGLDRVIWDELGGSPLNERSDDKPLTVASFDAGDGPAVFADEYAVGDALTDAPLFLGPKWHVAVPLEATYQAAWTVTPSAIRDRVEAP